MPNEKVVEAVAQAVETLRAGPDIEDTAMFIQLVDLGIERALAARLVEFLPTVYFRLILAKTGLRFPDKYRRVLPDGTLSPPICFSTEPIWNAAMEFAASEIKAGIAGRALLLIAGRSAEFDAVNKLLNSGSGLESIAIDVPTFRWPMQGPD